MIAKHTGTLRARIGCGLAVAAIALVAAAALGGAASASSAPSAAQSPRYGKKIAICHHTSSKQHPWVTLWIDIRAWPAHLQHGDRLGACSGPPTPSKSRPANTVAICHYTRSRTPPWVTLYINIHAWPAHLQHGDHLGACGNELPPTPPRPAKPKDHGRHR